MPNLLTPGVYIQEVALGPSPIQAVSTSVAGFVGETVRGPTSGTPSLVVSFSDFVNQFGSYATGKSLAYAVQGFFANGGQQAYISRVVNQTMTTYASLAPTNDGYLVRLSGLPTVSGANLFIALSSVAGLTLGANLMLLPIAGGSAPSYTVTVSAINPTSGVVTGVAFAPSTTIASGSNAATLPQATIDVVSTAGFPTAGSFLIGGINQTITYTGLTATTFTGCSGGAGALATGQTVTSGTSIASGSNGQALPQATIDVVSTAGFPATGSFLVGGINQTIAYTGLTATTFTGCTGGAGALATGQTVTNVSGPPLSGVGPTSYYAQITPSPGVPAPVLTVNARDLGFFANQISVYVDAYYSNSTTISGVAGTVLTLASVSFLTVNQQVQLDIAGSRDLRVVTAINAATNTVTLDTAPTGGPYAGGRLSLISWRVAIAYQGVPVETLTGLSSALDSGVSGNATAFASGVNTQSNWIRISTTAAPSISAFGNKFPTFALAQQQLLSGAPADVAAGPTDVIGVDVPPRTGLKALEQQDGISIIAAPGFGSGVLAPTSGVFDGVVAELIGQAERKQDRVAVFETLDGPSVDVNALLNERGKWNSQYAAMYAPWIQLVDPLTGATISVPPAGHVVGAYAATDNLRGVFKSPANVVLQGITGFSRDIPTGEQDLLNPAGVNVLRNFPGLGNVIWGARTIAADPLWKYISVRRLFVFIEQSLVQGTRYAVFEPNDLRLWARLRDSVANFLTTQWQAGALFGATAQQAFFVRVDETTTTQDDRDNGIVNILVGIAPVKPAEFIVFQIGQAPQSVIIAEQSS